MLRLNSAIPTAQKDAQNNLGVATGDWLGSRMPDMHVLPSEPVPKTLQFDVTGDVFPAYVNYGCDTTITSTSTSTSTFTWKPSSEPSSLIRIFSSTAGGFFVEDGMTVTCLTPDTGAFAFPTSVQDRLGAGFIGGSPIMSRVAVRTETTENSILFLIRESFAAE